METANAALDNALQPKARLTGKVIKTTIAGAVLDIGQKIPGVVHISQLSKDAVNRVEDVVHLGQVVDVWVRRVREDRVELTMVQPLGLEWKEIEPDMLVKGKVVRLEPYGAFVEIGAERPGMVHVSEISHDYIKNPSEVLKEGDEIEAKVLDIDRRKRQIRLSIKATLPKPEEVLAEVNKSETPKNKPKRGSKKEETAAEPESREPELTSFQLAFQIAQQRAEKKSSPGRSKTNKSNISKDSEDIFDRTLKNRITKE